jgi:hypothetical protein
VYSRPAALALGVRGLPPDAVRAFRDERVIAGCRGTNEALERLYDQVLEDGRAKLALA